MRRWLRMGRRFEWTMSFTAIVGFLVLGFIQTRGAQTVEVRLILWIYSAFCVFPLLCLATVAARWAQRKTAAAPLTRTVRTQIRVWFYAVLAIVMFAADRVWAKATGWSLGHVLLGDVAILALLIGITEFKQWRKRQSPAA